MSATDLGPLRKKYHIKTWKRSMTKKGHQKFWEIDNFLGEMRKFFRETPKKGRNKISSKIWPPVCEGLDPLVRNVMQCNVTTTMHECMHVCIIVYVCVYVYLYVCMNECMQI